MGDSLADIRQLVLDRMAASSVDPLYDPAIVDRTINASNKRLGREFDWPWLLDVDTISFAVAVATYTVTGLANFRHFKHLSHEGRKLFPVSSAEILVYSERTRDVPFYYSVVNNTLTVAPTPSAAVTLSATYVVDEANLLDDEDTCRLPAAYTELLVLKTCITLAQRANNPTRMGMFKSEYKDAISEARDEVRRTRELPRITADESLWRSA
jgi:hypothetical protein